MPRKNGEKMAQMNLLDLTTCELLPGRIHDRVCVRVEDDAGHPRRGACLPPSMFRLNGFQIKLDQTINQILPQRVTASSACIDYCMENEFQDILPIAESFGNR